MNQRLRALAEKANIEFTYDPTETPVRAFVECWEDDLEKFADMIVKDCCDVLIKWKHEPFPFDESVAVSLIREHFGVER
jgi:hypothetical protein